MGAILLIYLMTNDPHPLDEQLITDDPHPPDEQLITEKWSF